MKLITISAVCFIFFYYGIFAQKVEKNRYAFFVGAGPAFPDTYPEWQTPGHSFNSGISYSLNSFISLWGEFDYNKLGFDQKGVEEFWGFTDIYKDFRGGPVTIFTVTANMGLSAKGEWIIPLYGYFGFGYLLLDVKGISALDTKIYIGSRKNVRNDLTEGDITFRGGAGLDITISGTISLLLEYTFSTGLKSHGKIDVDVIERTNGNITAAYGSTLNILTGVSSLKPKFSILLPKGEIK